MNAVATTELMRRLVLTTRRSYGSKSKLLMTTKRPYGSKDKASNDRGTQYLYGKEIYPQEEVPKLEFVLVQGTDSLRKAAAYQTESTNDNTDCQPEDRKQTHV
ncbi:unnamed protein product [Ceratitis capitata]|uniref:(Mediterranean fruit fly) hypothetical protein n=1 Tax=Ceratitis capitata TaxID=7213 RepID=A0A811VIK9_CERCA|nr:unnamed protein product [Ceratitis capitata]